MRDWGWYLFSAALVLATFIAAVPVPPPHGMYVDQPPLAHTGGFGEPTCHACHFDQPLNASGGTLSLSEFPEAYTPGQTYRLVVRLHKSGLSRGGFQLAARFTDSGKQAGELRALGDRVAIAPVDSSSVQYATHTPAGVQPIAPDSIQWIVEWKTPSADSAAAVQFHASANASNYDASAFGDFIYTTTRHTQPQTKK